MAKAVFDEAALARKYLNRKLAAVFACHDPFDVLEEDRIDTAVIVELFATIVDADYHALDATVWGAESPWNGQP